MTYCTSTASCQPDTTRKAVASFDSHVVYNSRLHTPLSGTVLGKWLLSLTTSDQQYYTKGLKCNFKVVGTVKIPDPCKEICEPISILQRAPVFLVADYFIAPLYPKGKS